jgi:hypothetical protein
VECPEFSRAVEDLNGAFGSIDGVPGADRVWKQQLEAQARNGLGAAYAGLGQSDLALEQFGKSIGLCPDISIERRPFTISATKLRQLRTTD